MKRLVLEIALGLLATAALVAQPKLAVEKLEYDLGSVYAGKSLTGRFSVKNIGNKPLKIVSIQPSCGCTTVKSPRADLAPNTSDNIEIEFNSTGFRGDLIKYVTINTNDSLMPSLTIHFKVRVKEELEPLQQTSMVWFGSINVGTEREQVYELKNISSKPIAIVGFKSSNADINVSADKNSVKPSDSIRFTIKTKPARTGYVNEKITITTDSKNQPMVQVSVAYIGTQAQ